MRREVGLKKEAEEEGWIKEAELRKEFGLKKEAGLRKSEVGLNL